MNKIKVAIIDVDMTIFDVLGYQGGSEEILDVDGSGYFIKPYYYRLNELGHTRESILTDYKNNHGCYCEETKLYFQNIDYAHYSCMNVMRSFNECLLDKDLDPCNLKNVDEIHFVSKILEGCVNTHSKNNILHLIADDIISEYPNIKQYKIFFTESYGVKLDFIKENNRYEIVSLIDDNPLEVKNTDFSNISPDFTVYYPKDTLWSFRMEDVCKELGINVVGYGKETVI